MTTGGQIPIEKHYRPLRDSRKFPAREYSTHFESGVLGMGRSEYMKRQYDNIFCPTLDCGEYHWLGLIVLRV